MTHNRKLSESQMHFIIGALPFWHAVRLWNPLPSLPGRKNNPLDRPPRHALAPHKFRLSPSLRKSAHGIGGDIAYSVTALFSVAIHIRPLPRSYFPSSVCSLSLYRLLSAHFLRLRSRPPLAAPSKPPKTFYPISPSVIKPRIVSSSLRPSSSTLHICNDNTALSVLASFLHSASASAV